LSYVTGLLGNAAVRIFESGLLYILMGINKQTRAKTPPSNITEPNAL
jgi:hypothetical protein